MLVQLAVAFSSGLFIGSLVPYLPTVTFIILLGAAVGVTLATGQGAWSVDRGVLLYAALLVGVIHWTWADRTRETTVVLTPDSPRQVHLEGRIVEPVRRAADHVIMVVRVESADGVPVSSNERRLLRVTWKDPDLTILHGERIAFVGRVRAPAGFRNPGGVNFAAYAVNRGLAGAVSLHGDRAVAVIDSAGHEVWWDIWKRIDDWRNRVRTAAVASLDGASLGLFLAMVIGEASYVPIDIRDLFMATGTVHILSISGSHLSLIGIMCFALIRMACRWLPERALLCLSRKIVPPRIGAVVTGVLVAGYSLLAGAEVATIRSLIMIWVFLVAVWLGRMNNLLNALAAAALLVLAGDPHSLFDLSFQLSYLSVAAIAMVIQRMDKPHGEDEPRDLSRVRRLGRWTRQYLTVTLAVTLATMPLVSYHFNQMGWIGVIGNLVVLPLAGFCIVPIGLMGAIMVLCGGLTALPGAGLIDVAGSLMVRVLEKVAEAPAVPWYVASPAPAAIVAFYAVMLVSMHRRVRMSRWASSISIIVLTAFLGWWAWSPRDLPGDNTIRVTFLDVGQGDASLIEAPGGATVLIDGGAAYDRLDLGRGVVGPYLWDRGIRTLDYVIATHPQLDHIGGLSSVIRNFSVRRLWGLDLHRPDGFATWFDRVVGAKGLREDRPVAGEAVPLDDLCSLLVLNPRARSFDGSAVGNGRRARDLNNQSIVVRISCGRQSFLFAADAEAEALEAMAGHGDRLSSRVLKVPHHGSKGSVVPEWIRAVHPEVAVISVGALNRYGHPAARTLAAYQGEGSLVLRTDRDGAVWMTGDIASGELTVHTAREVTPVRLAVARGMLEREWRNLALMGSRWVGREV